MSHQLGESIQKGLGMNNNENLNASISERLLRIVREKGVAGLVQRVIRRSSILFGSAIIGPTRIQINPRNFLCNHFCPMCWRSQLDSQTVTELRRDDRIKGMVLSDYQDLFDSIPWGLERVMILGGGEPLMHPDCVKIMQDIKSRGIDGSLLSNGTLMGQKPAEAILNMKWDETNVSVHAADPGTYQDIHGVDEFYQLQENLKKFSELRATKKLEGVCKLVIVNVLQRSNLSEIDKLFFLGEEVNADFIRFMVILLLRKTDELTSDEKIRASERLKFAASASRVPSNINEVIRILKIEDQPITERRKRAVPVNRCFVGFRDAFIDSAGSVRPCCFSKDIMGNLSQESFSDIWFGKRYEDFRSRMLKRDYPGYCIEPLCRVLI